MKWCVILLLALTGMIAGCQLNPVVPERPIRIAFMTNRDGDFEIYIMNRDGSNQTNLTSHEAADGLPAWSARANAFVFASNRGQTTMGLYRMGRDGSAPSVLVEEVPAIPIPLIWSSTGEWLAFGSGTGADIYLLDPVEGQLINLTENPAQDNFEDWSPDGQQILFTSDRAGVPALYSMRIEGGVPILLTDLDSGNAAGRWSPLGSKIAFMSDRDQDVDIYLMDVDGSNTVRLTDTPGFDGYPRWSPDGSKIAFLTSRDGNSEIYVMNADGSEQTNLTNSPTSEESVQGDFAWSPDGAQIMFHSDRDGDVEIYVMNADGSNSMNVSNSPGTDFGSIWVR